LSSFGKQQQLVVSGAMENVDDFDDVGADAIENQIVAKRAPTNPRMFVTRNQWVSARCIRQGFTFFPQFLNECNAASAFRSAM
jgi:hypothetical protein